MIRAALLALACSIGACAQRGEIAEAVPPPVAVAHIPRADAESPAPASLETPDAAHPPASAEDASAVDAAQATDAGVDTTPHDPLNGVFTLDDATRGLPGSGPLVATIATERGTLRCDLFADRAPITVANFVGLARGVRPWLTPDGTWEARPAYDGTVFHRIIRGFMIQGGDPYGDGKGEPGFVLPDEPWEVAKHDHAGQLCIANRGPDTNGMQFFITDAAAPHLDGGRNAYTIFGKCAPLSVVHALAAVPVNGQRPIHPPLIKSIKISRNHGGARAH